MKAKTLSLLSFVIAHFAFVLSAAAQGTAFTYQGRLNSSGTPYTGVAEFQATLWTDASGGSQLAANTPPQSIVGVTNGLFVLPLDFGANFPGAGRWLQLEVRTGLGPFTPLAPRQPITPTPYAITASNLTGRLAATQLSGAIPSASLAGTYSGAVTFNNAGNSFSGNGAGLTGLNANNLTSGTVPDARIGTNILRTGQLWQLGGNAGTSPGAQFLGTTDNRPLEFKVNGQRALRIEPATNSFLGFSPNVIGGSLANVVSDGVAGAVIGGGGSTNSPNRVGGGEFRYRRWWTRQYRKRRFFDRDRRQLHRQRLCLNCDWKFLHRHR